MPAVPNSPAQPPASQHREIIALAGPAFLTLVAEPLFLLADSAIVGHLGTVELAALGVAGTVVTTLVGLCVFLAYGTTAAVARRVGAGDSTGACQLGIDGMWLAIGIGVALVVVSEATLPWMVGPFGAGPTVAADAVRYLRVSTFGVPGLLVGLAATGILRGFADTRTPLVVAVVTQTLNVAANLVLVYGIGSWAGLGLVGSAVGTLISQTVGGLMFAAVVVAFARRHGVGLAPHAIGVRAAGRASAPLFVRTLTLRVALLMTALVASGFGPAALAAHQVAMNVWNLLALALDAVAIAAQTLTGQSLGAGDAAHTRRVTNAMVRWGIGAGVILGLLALAGHRVIPMLFTTDPVVRNLLAGVLVIAAVWQPVSGVVFVLDGVLIGAGDTVYLAWAGVVTLVAFVPLALLVWISAAGLNWLWWAFGAFMLARLVTLAWRARGERWLRLGAQPR